VKDFPFGVVVSIPGMDVFFFGVVAAAFEI
jgi:hypothetical protein